MKHLSIKSLSTSTFLAVFLFFHNVSFASYYEFYKTHPTPVTTQEYIAMFDQKRYERSGCDYHHEKFALSRVGKPVDAIDCCKDYDFKLVNRVSQWLKKVNRDKALKFIFTRITQGCNHNNYYTHRAIITFLHKASFHNRVQPLHLNGLSVTDPLLLLELGEMWCGNVARLGCDIMSAGGFRCRIVQVACHQTAEVFYDNDWHLSELDLAGGGEAVGMPIAIPSVAKLSRENPHHIDTVSSHTDTYLAFYGNGSSTGCLTYPSYYFFSSDEKQKRLYYEKTKTPYNPKDPYYGWLSYSTISATDIKLSNLTRYYEPSPACLQSLQLQEDQARLEWQIPTACKIAECVVYLSTKSRGWNYYHFYGGETVKPFWTPGWSPEKYDLAHQEPPYDAGKIVTQDNFSIFQIPKGQTRYVTVMLVDEHGKAVGRKLYYQSIELRIPNE